MLNFLEEKYYLIFNRHMLQAIVLAFAGQMSKSKFLSYYNKINNYNK